MTFAEKFPWKEFAAVVIAALGFNFLIAQTFAAASKFLKYTSAAELYLAGDLSDERVFDFSPFLFHLAVEITRWFSQPVIGLEILQLAAAAWFAGMLFLLLDHRLGRPWALILTPLVVLDRRLLIYQRIIEPDIWLLAAVTSTVALLVTKRSPLAAGCWGALSLTIRPTLLPLLILVPLYFAIDRRRSGWRASLSFLVPVLLVSLLLGGRAHHYGGRFSTPVMNPGTVFFEGNNPLSHGTSAVYPPTVLHLTVQAADSEPDSAHRFYREVARAAQPERELSIELVNRYWAGRARSYLVDQPVQALVKVREKVLRAAHGFRWHDIPTATIYDQQLIIPYVPYSLLVSLALCGCLVEVRRWRECVPLYCVGAFQVLVMAVFYVSARQQLQLLPSLFYFAAVAVHWLRSQQRSRLVVCVLILLGSLSLVLPDDAIRDERYQRRAIGLSEPLFSEVRSRLESESLARFPDVLVNAYALAPFLLDRTRPPYFPSEHGLLDDRISILLDHHGESLDPSLRFDRGILRWQTGRLESARSDFRVLATEQPTWTYRKGYQNSQPLVHLARVTAAKGDFDGARELLATAAQRAPGDPFVLAEQVALGDDPQAARLLQRYISPFDAQFLIGKALLAHQRDREAASAFAFVAQRLPQMRDAHLYLAAALASTGNLDLALRHYLIAIEHQMEPLREPSRIAELFRRLAQERDDVGSQFLAARVLHQLGWFTEAAELLDEVERSGDQETLESMSFERERQRLDQSLSAIPMPRTASE